MDRRADYLNIPEVVIDRGVSLSPDQVLEEYERGQEIFESFFGKRISPGSVRLIICANSRWDRTNCYGMADINNREIYLVPKRSERLKVPGAWKIVLGHEMGHFLHNRLIGGDLQLEVVAEAFAGYSAIVTRMDGDWETIFQHLKESFLARPGLFFGPWNRIHKYPYGTQRESDAATVHFIHANFGVNKMMNMVDLCSTKAEVDLLAAYSYDQVADSRRRGLVIGNINKEMIEIIGLDRASLKRESFNWYSKS